MAYVCKATLIAAVSFAVAASSASAHAFLDHAVPAVGATVTAAPSDLQLTFTEGVEPAFSSVKLAMVGGGPVATGKAVVAPGNPSLLRLPLGQALKPGTYEVTWRVVAVDTHPTSGKYRFTVAP